MVKYSSLGGMAQLVEHSLHMRGVTGSSPVVSTNKNAHQFGCAFFVHRDNKRARTRKLVFGVRRLLATACVMHCVYRSRHFASLRCLFLFFTMQSSPCCLLFQQRTRMATTSPLRNVCATCDRGHTARDWPSVTIADGESCCLLFYKQYYIFHCESGEKSLQ